MALNPGVGAGDSFVTDTEIVDELRIVDLNVRSTVQVAKYVVRDMVRRGEGRILFTSSIASTMPGSLNAVYMASKSFVQSFALALRSELKETGVSVTSLIPDPTDAHFFNQVEMLDTRASVGEEHDPADLARDGFDALMAGDERAVAHSLKAETKEFASRVNPDRVKAELHRRHADPGSAPTVTVSSVPRRSAPDRLQAGGGLAPSESQRCRNALCVAACRPGYWSNDFKSTVLTSSENQEESK